MLVIESSADLFLYTLSTTVRHTNLHLRHDILDQRPWPQAQQLVGAGEADPQARSK